MLAVLVIGVEPASPVGLAARPLCDRPAPGGHQPCALDLKQIADLLRMSVTSTEEALARLDTERSKGRALPQICQPERLSADRLKNLYEFSGALIDLALAFAGKTAGAAPAPRRGAGGDTPYADAMSDLTSEIAIAQDNQALSEHILALNDRLLPARRCEPRLFSGASEEAAALRSLLDSGKVEELRLCLRRHHDERLSRAQDLAGLLNQQSGEQQ